MRFTMLCRALLAAGLVTGHPSGNAQTSAVPRLMSPAFSSSTIAANDPFTLVFDAVPSGATVHLKVGVAHLTGLLRAKSALEFVYPANEVPLEAGYRGTQYQQ